VKTLRRYRALTIAHAAAATVEGPACIGSVQSVFRRAANLRIPPDALLAITDPLASRVPNGIVVDAVRSPGERFLDLRVEMTVRVGHGCVDIPSAGLRVETAGAAHWDPRPRFPSRSLDSVGRARNLDWLAWLIHRDAAGKPWSLASLLAPPVAPAQEIRAPGHHVDAQRFLLAQRARPAIAALLAALQEDEIARISAAARRLAGLGHGLTPAGDDLLIGVCAALTLAAAMLPVSHHSAHASAASLRERALAIADAADQTTTLSAVWLRHAANAEFSLEVGRVVVALAGDDAAGLQEAVSALLAVGASSGLDTAAGLLYGTRALLGSSTALPNVDRGSTLQEHLRFNSR
jgi:hypothetical protein